MKEIITDTQLIELKIKIRFKRKPIVFICNESTLYNNIIPQMTDDSKYVKLKLDGEKMYYIKKDYIINFSYQKIKEKNK